jgi:hypothetical protein
MKLFPFLLVNLAAFAILHFAWIPAAERRLCMDRSMASISRGALLSLLGFGRSVFLTATLTTAALIFVLIILQMLGGATTAEVTSQIETIYRWRVLVLGFGPVWGGIAITLMVLALAIYARRSGRLKMEKTFQEMYTRKFEQLRRDYELGKLKEMPPTAEMQEVTKKIGQINETLKKLEDESVREDPKTILMRQQLNEQIALLDKYYVALDMQRRIDPELDPDEAALPDARTKWEKFQTFFISRGLLASLGGTSRVLFLAGLTLLVPSLLGVYSSSTATTLNRRLVELKDLRVELSRKEFNQEKDRLGEPENELSDEDEQDLQEVARAYEQMTMPMVIPSGMRSSMYTLRSTLVRESVLSHAASQANVVREQHASGAKWEQHASGSKVATLTPLEREVVVAPEASIHTRRGPVTPQGRRVYSELQDIARRSPSFMDKVRTGLRSFQRPASSYDITHALFSQIAGTLAGETPGELGNVLRGVGTNNRVFAGFTEMQSRQFLSDLMGGTTLDEAVSRTATPDLSHPFVGTREKAEFHSIMRTVVDDLPITSVNEKLADYPPSVDVAPEKHINMQKAGDLVNSYRKKAMSLSVLRNSEVYADSVATFSDWFPAQLGTDSKTRRGELLAGWRGESSGPDFGGDPPGTGGNPNPGGTGGGPPISSGSGSGGGGGGGGGSSIKPRPAPPSASRFSFARSRSFIGLRGFSRVGGVLIGRTPNNGAAANQNFTDLRWEVKGSHIRFILIGKDGQQFRSRPYRVSVAYQALNYAADGRPLAVTMASADPLLDLKILLHPTLIDSPLGHRTIELDRFVDTYTANSEARKEAEKRFSSHHGLYSFAWAIRALAFLEAISGGQYDSELENYKQPLRAIVHNDELKWAMTNALQDAPTIGDPQQSPLSVKKEFYDQTLVEILTRPQTSILEQTIRAEVMTEVYSLSSSGDEEKMKALFERWMSPPPDYEVWSGVRERDFEANPADILVPEGAEMPVPFDFMLQVAFTSPPSFANEADAETYTDTQPWEFPLLRDMIQSTVTREIKNDKSGRAQIIIADISEFAMLQRLFRMAFNGHLGEDFPVEKMMELGESLAAGGPKTVTRTLRWHTPGVDRIAAVELNRSSPEQREVLTLIQELRNALGVSRDDEQVLREHKGAFPKLD